MSLYRLFTNDCQNRLWTDCGGIPALPPMMGLARTLHYFDPCELLRPDARSELRPEHRRRQRGGGWEKV